MLAKRLLANFSGVCIVSAGLLRHAICEIDYKYRSFSADVAGGVKDHDRHKMVPQKGQVVLVTGGTGFLGQHIVKLLHERAPYVKEIRVFDKVPYAQKLEYISTKPVQSVVGDIRDRGRVKEAMVGVDAVIHTAGLVSFGTFPDHQGMEEVNVEGTRNVIVACVEQNVPRLVYTSTIDVVIGHNDLIDGDEQLPVPCDFLFPGYPDTKSRAEESVLRAHGTSLARGNGSQLSTLALRPNVMYGELDPFYVTNGLKSANKNGGVLQRVGNGKALFQQAYVGNMAWGHLAALEKLETHPCVVGGQAYFLTDDTPKMNSFIFMEHFLKDRGLELSKNSIPCFVMLAFLKPAECFAKILKPVFQLELPVQACSIKYLNMNIYFSRRKAETTFNYHPIYTFEDSMMVSRAFYKDLSLGVENDKQKGDLTPENNAV